MRDDDQCSGWVSGRRRVRRPPPSRRSQAWPIAALVLDSERLESGSIRSPGGLQIMLVLEGPQRGGRFRPHPAVNRELRAIGVECRLDTFNELLVRHRPGRRRGRRCSRLWRRRSRRSLWHRCGRGGGLALTRCAPSKCNGNQNSRRDGKVARSCDHVGRPFRFKHSGSSLALHDREQRGNPNAGISPTRQPRFGTVQWPGLQCGSTV